MMNLEGTPLYYLIGGIALIFTLWLWAMLDINNLKDGNQEKRGAWIFVLLFLPLLGSLAYFTFGRNSIQRSAS